MNAIQLNCQPAKEGNALVFRYRVTNQGGTEAYVMHAVADATPSGEPFANEAEAVVVLGPGQIAVVGKFPAPLPADWRMARALIPLARRLAPAETFDSCLHIPMPFAETSPYYGDLRLRQYERGGNGVGGARQSHVLPAQHAPNCTLDEDGMLSTDMADWSAEPR